jgi:hypothetical protein
MGVVGWVLLLKGSLFLFGGRHVVDMLMAAHPVTFGHMTRGEKGLRRYVANIRCAGFILALAGGLLIWISG